VVNRFHDLYLQGDSEVAHSMLADRDNHIKEHKKLAVHVRDIENRLRSEGIVSASELSGFIVEWVTGIY
jgi:hypothetical protein